MRSALRVPAPRTAACRSTRSADSPFPGALQFLNPADDQIAFDTAEPVDEEHSVEVIHLMLERACEQSLTFDRHRYAFTIESLITARAGRRTVALKPGTLR